MYLSNCATTGLETYVPSEAAPWGRPRAMHLFRRVGFGGSPDEIELAVLEGPAATVDRLLQEVVDRPLRPDPHWAGWDAAQFAEAGEDMFTAYVDWGKAFMFEALEHGTREKMELFWQNHFVVKFEQHSCPSYHHDYMTTITRNAFGNLKQFVVEVTRSPAMLMFLNGYENQKHNPNENYARELFELFTLGVDNGYTQRDITEASRCLTGFNGWTSYCGPVEWADWGYDDTNKTVFGRTGNFNYEQLIDVLFEERAELIAPFICRKLYRYFVGPTVDENIVAAMAETMLANDFEIMPVVSELFRSAHFFDEAHFGSRIKSPMELHLTWIREGGFGTFETQPEWGFWAMSLMGQYLGEPPDVAGWPGERAWIDSNRIALRWEFTDGFFWAFFNRQSSLYPNFAKALTEGSNDPAVIAAAFLDFFLPVKSLSTEDYALATDVFKSEVPENYYHDGVWNLNFDSAPWQCVLLLRHIGRLPEFQLC